jgi:hypothetical protein
MTRDARSPRSEPQASGEREVAEGDRLQLERVG